MTVNSSSSGFSSVCRTTGARVIASLFVAALFLGLATPSAAHAAEVTSLDSMQIAVGLETTTTTGMTMTVALPATTTLPATFSFYLPGGYSIEQQGEFDSSPEQPTATTKAVAGTANSEKAMTPYSVTLTKSHNFFLVAHMPVSIYNSSAMGNGGAPLAAFSILAATDITTLQIAIAPPAANMVGAGGKDMKTFNAGNNVKLYGQEFKDVKKGDEKTAQVAFMLQSQAQQDAATQAAQNKAASQSPLNNFLSQPLVWVLGALLIIVIVVLVFVIMRQRTRDLDDESELEDEGGDDFEDENDFNGKDEEEADLSTPDTPDTDDEETDEEHAAATSDS
ncbi:MAG: hypothetical protein FWD65_04570 [Coriobacteriia bacterium]|nr:hypothetical protein [Coriobacteriia bacterium]